MTFFNRKYFLKEKFKYKNDQIYKLKVAHYKETLNLQNFQGKKTFQFDESDKTNLLHLLRSVMLRAIYERLM